MPEQLKEHQRATLTEQFISSVDACFQAAARSSGIVWEFDYIPAQTNYVVLVFNRVTGKTVMVDDLFLKETSTLIQDRLRSIGWPKARVNLRIPGFFGKLFKRQIKLKVILRHE